MIELVEPQHITLFAHQRETARFLVERKRAFVHSDIGTGKTLAAACAAVSVMSSWKTADPVLIVAPKSTLNFVWERAFFFHYTYIRTKALVGTRSRRLSLLDDEDTSVFIINPEALAIVKDHPRLKNLRLVVIDEHTYFKNARTKRWRALKSLVNDETIIWAMSGSPMPQAPTDMYAPMKLICPERLPRASFTGFKDWSMRQVSQFKWVPRPGIEEKIAMLLEGISIRHTRDECIDLPPTQNAHIKVAPSSEQKKLQALLEKEAVAMLDSGEVTALNEAVLTSKILQVAAGAVKYTRSDGEPDVHLVPCPDRQQALVDIIEAADGPVLVFSPYVGPIQTITSALDGAGLTYHVVTGATSQTQRDAAFDAVQQRTTDVLVAQPAAMSHGLTLTASNVVVWWGLPWSNEIYEQATGRIVRASQTRKQYIIHLVSSVYEDNVARRLEDRQKLQGTLLEIIANQRR